MKRTFWISKDQQLSCYRLWLRKPTWNRKEKEYWGSKRERFSWLIINFCSPAFDKKYPDIAFEKGCKKITIDIEVKK